MLILRTLSEGRIHGYGVAQRIHQWSEQAILVEEGSLYPALHRLAKRGFVRSTWGLSENNRRARFYELTRRGASQLESDLASWDRIVSVIGRILRGPESSRPEEGLV